MTAAASATRSTAACTARTSRRRCASCSPPWRPSPRTASPSRASPRPLPRQRPDREEPGLQRRDGAPRGAGHDPPAGREGGGAADGALEGQGRARLPHGEGGARDPLPLPPARDRGGGQPPLATRLAVPRAALTGHPELEAVAAVRSSPPPGRPFADPDPFREFVYPSAIEAKRAIADLLAIPLGRLTAEERAAIDAILRETLERAVVLTRVRA